MKLVLISLLLLITSCAGLKDWSKKVMEPKSDMDEVHEVHRPLEKQRLLPRPGYEGFLTNRVCTKWYGSTCESESIKKYDLKDKKVRDNFIELNFACYVAKKRYRLCPDKPGFCRKTRAEKKCIRWGKRFLTRKKYCKEYSKPVVVQKYLDAVEDFQFLLDGTLECNQGM